jgi:hypothetical protein
MTAQRPRLVVSESTEKTTILIIDKNGHIGEALVEKLKDQFSIIFLTSKPSISNTDHTRIFFGKKIPILPDIQYSAIITIYQGEKNTLEILPPIAKKAHEDKAACIFATSISQMDKTLRKFLDQKIYENTTEVFYGEVFGQKDLQDGLLPEYMQQVRSQSKIEILGNGLQKIYPVLFEDVIEAIIAITFAIPKKNKSILVFPKSGYTSLTVARIFQKLDPDIKIDFKKGKVKEAEYFFPPDAHPFYPTYNLEEKINKIDLTKIKQINVKSSKNHALKHSWGNSRKINFKTKIRRKYQLLVMAILFFLLPLCVEFLLLLSGTVFLAQSLSNWQKNKTSLAQNYNILARSVFLASNFIIQNVSAVNPVLMMYKEPLTQKSQAGLSLAGVQADFLESAAIMKNITEEKSLDPKNDFQQVVAKTKNSIITLQRLKAEGNLPEVIKEKLETLEYPLALLANTIDVFPELLGFEHKKKYLILFQNNMELRPGGGFIGSYGVVEVRNAKLGKLKIQDVYDADGQLSTHIEPPFALRRYLGSSHLFLRDSNFEVDFITNAQKAKAFLELETGEKVDGVIAIDTWLVKELIEAFGPLSLHDYNETVTAENFYLMTQTHVEKDFFPGSTQKKDFLRAVFNALDAKLTQSDNIPIDKLVQKISEAIKQKHLLVAVPDSKIQNILTVNMLSSSIRENRQKQDNEFLDFIGINESNLGMNKANYYLKRAIEHRVAIDEEGNAGGEITITYENRSSKQSAFGGDYKNYLRFMLPASATLEAVEINDNPVATISAITQPAEFTRKGFIPPAQLEIEKNLIEGKAIYGFLTLIPMQTSQKISIIYSLNNVINPAKAVFTYNLNIHKQPGTDNDPYSLSISYPSAFQPVQGNEGLSDVGGKLLYESSLTEDKNLTLKFSKK